MSNHYPTILGHRRIAEFCTRSSTVFGIAIGRCCSNSWNLLQRPAHIFRAHCSLRDNWLAHNQSLRIRRNTSTARFRCRTNRGRSIPCTRECQQGSWEYWLQQVWSMFLFATKACTATMQPMKHKTPQVRLDNKSMLTQKDIVELNSQRRCSI